MRELYEKLTIIYSNHFLNNGKDFVILKYSVVVQILASFHDAFAREIPKEGEEKFVPIDSIAPEEKKRYWELAFTYHQDKEMRIKASKSAYVLEIMTNNIE